jgi:hypothetical protein
MYITSYNGTLQSNKWDVQYIIQYHTAEQQMGCTLHHTMPYCRAPNGIPQDKYRKSFGSIVFEKNGNEYQEKMHSQVL